MIPILVKSDDVRRGRKAKVHHGWLRAVTGGTGVNGLISPELMQVFANSKGYFHPFIEFYVIHLENQEVKIWSCNNPEANLLGMFGSILRRCLKIASKGNCENNATRSFSWINIQLVSGSSSWKKGPLPFNSVNNSHKQMIDLYCNQWELEKYIEQFMQSE